MKQDTFEKAQAIHYELSSVKEIIGAMKDGDELDIKIEIKVKGKYSKVEISNEDIVNVAGLDDIKNILEARSIELIKQFGEV